MMIASLSAGAGFANRPVGTANIEIPSSQTTPFPRCMTSLLTNFVKTRRTKDTEEHLIHTTCFCVGWFHNIQAHTLLELTDRLIAAPRRCSFYEEAPTGASEWLAQFSAEWFPVPTLP